MLHDYWINTGDQLTVEMFVVLVFAKVLSEKYVRKNKTIFFDSKSPLYVLREKTWHH